MNVFDMLPTTFVLDFEDDQIEYQLNNFLNFFDKNNPTAPI